MIEEGGDDEVRVFRPSNLGMPEEMLASCMIYETTKTHSVAVSEVKPTLGEGVLRGQRVGVIYWFGQD
jgi:hypothetical protein